MNVISRVQFPQTSSTTDLYMKLDVGISIDGDEGGRKISLYRGQTMSLNTYFNSCYEHFYQQYTNLSRLYYLLKLEGDFEVAVYREDSSNRKQLLQSEKFFQCERSHEVKVLLPVLNLSQPTGRIYLSITCLSEQGVFAQGLVVTEQEKQAEVSLAVIICTYKKEVYVKKTVKAILKDSFLQQKKLKVFVVDNGRTINQSDFEGEGVKLIPNRNVGGSGGFTKGLMSALQEGDYSHFLFMDDDIELDTEVIYRLFTLYEYAQQDFAVAGSMLDLYKKHILYEAGALYNKYLDNDGNIRNRPFALTSLKNNLDLRNPASLNLLLLEEGLDFGGFYFLSFSRKVVDGIGLPLPFFIKIDDLEYSLRIKEYLGHGVVAFPSLGVWHEPFYAKRPAWDLYYSNRNKLITDAIHDSINYFSTIINFTKNIVFYLLLFDYNTAQTYVKAFEDYLQGPSFLKNNDPEILHTKICEYSKIHKTQTILTNSIFNSEDDQITKVGKLQKLVSVLTLNGQLLPKFMISDESAIIRYGAKAQDRDSVSKGFAKKRIIFIQAKNPLSYQNEVNSQAAINILFVWFKAAIGSILRWSNVSREWKKAATDLTSIQFWQNYLEPSSKTDSQHSNYVKSGEAA